MKCRKCGRKIDQNAVFCGWCGTPVPYRTGGPEWQYREYEPAYGNTGYETQQRRRRKHSDGRGARAVLLVMLFAFLLVAAGDILLIRSIAEKKSSEPQTEYGEEAPKMIAALGAGTISEIIATPAVTTEPKTIAPPAETAEPVVVAPAEAEPQPEPAVFDSVSYETIRDDRSVTTQAQDGSTAVLQNYFDHVSITEEGYPYKDQINAILQQASDGFMEKAEAAREQFQSNPPYSKATYQDYVDVMQVYDESAMLSIKEAGSWYLGGAFNTSYYTYTFDLATGEQLTLPELLGMSEDDTRNLVRSVVANDSVFGQYSDFYDKYFDSHSPSEYKFYIDLDGTVMVCFNEYEVGPGSLDAPCFALGNLSDYRGA